MTLTRAATIFALAAGLSACAALPVGRDFSKLSMGDKLDYYSCVFRDVGSDMTPRGNSAGSMLDSMLANGSKIQETTRKAGNLCAVKHFIDPTTIPGLR
ncbi:MAG: hypothetical protein JWO78_1432 [Micavibrio sp.]|nr:hypothetical protein [Micavibrio sp.]